jgi:D-alanine transaminase
MDTAFFNGVFLPKEQIRISPDDRGFLFGDGVYEVMKWYAGFFYDPASHLARLKRSLREIRIDWLDPDSFLHISEGLIKANNLLDKYALVYFQVTRGASPRNHSFPDPAVEPTIYAFARETEPVRTSTGPVAGVMTAKDIRWSRCDIKSIALLANTLSFQNAHERGMKECIFIRDGYITEGSRSNFFLVADGRLYTHPESDYILSGITRKNMIRYAMESGIPVVQEPFHLSGLPKITEAFITNTSAEVTPVAYIDGSRVGNGKPGPVTRQLQKKFNDELTLLKDRY